MNPEAKKQVQALILNNREAIKNLGPKEALKKDPELLKKKFLMHENQTRHHLVCLRNHFNDLFPLLKDVRLLVKDITEESHVCAIYLILCNVFETWEAFFSLICENRHFAALVLIRNIKEQLAIIDLFALEYANGTDTNLKKWFAGEIITHGTCREEMHKFFEKYKEPGDLEIKNLATYLYAMESQPAHGSYISILESISPFTEDYDFEGYTSSFRTIAAARYGTGTMTTTNIAMKFAATSVLKDQDFLKKVQSILIKYNPEMRSAVSDYIEENF